MRHFQPVNATLLKDMQGATYGPVGGHLPADHTPCMFLSLHAREIIKSL